MHTGTYNVELEYGAYRGHSGKLSGRSGVPSFPLWLVKTSFSNLSQQKHDSCLVPGRREVSSSILRNRAKGLPQASARIARTFLQLSTSKELGTGDGS